MTAELVARAATALKKMNAPTFAGKYVCIILPSVAVDLRSDPDWVAAHQYAAATELFSGEIGELHGVRFVETTEAKIFRGDDLASDSRTHNHSLDLTSQSAGGGQAVDLLPPYLAVYVWQRIS